MQLNFYFLFILFQHYYCTYVMNIFTQVINKIVHGALVFYCCTINYCKRSVLFHSFHGSQACHGLARSFAYSLRLQSMCWLGPCVSPEALPSLHTCWQNLVLQLVVGLRPLHPSGQLQLPATWPSSQALHNIVVHFIKASKGQSLYVTTAKRNHNKHGNDIHHPCCILLARSWSQVLPLLEARA